MSAKRKPKHEPEVRKKVVKVGRPSDFREEFIEEARILCQQGATYYDLADMFNVNVTTIWRWRNLIPEFCSAIKEAKTEADDRVVNALYRRAVGYSQKVDKVLLKQDGGVVRTQVTEFIPPDVTACIFWLKNRQPELWRDKREVAVQTTQIADEELIQDILNDIRAIRAKNVSPPMIEGKAEDKS